MEALTDMEAIERIYNTRLREDFARNERKPLSAIRRALERDEYRCWGLFREDALLGYAFFVRYPDGDGTIYLFDYLAIDRSLRDTGLGTAFLSRLAECFTASDLVIGEVDDPDRADGEERVLRERRLRFYYGNGCVDTGVRSVVFGADYRILEMPTGPRRSREEIRAAYDRVYRHIFPSVIYRRCFSLRDP